MAWPHKHPFGGTHVRRRSQVGGNQQRAKFMCREVSPFGP